MVGKTKSHTLPSYMDFSGLHLQAIKLDQIPLVG